ncbi:MAG: peptidoglycan editing factor PgeF [Prevotellaceae bacterium]|nr:peptidoglycan editing factor PgeF [Prevotellaceae bacterium]
MRQGGASVGAYASLNITHYCGDSAQAVAENRKRLCAALGLSDDRLILPRQTHGTAHVIIDEAFLALPRAEQSGRLEGVDAVVCRVPNVCIGVSTADCIPILLADPVSGTSAAVHAGWRGTVERIAARCIEMMQAEAGCKPENLHAVVGPGIGMEAFEVGDEVYERFAAAGFPMHVVAARRGAKWHIDLPAANFLQLEAAGLPLDHIRMSGICTFSHPDQFFSARRLGLHSGRIFNGILMQ